MNLPTDLQHEVAERAVQPGFDAVLDRAGASRRRRRTTIASACAAAVVVTGLAAVAGGVVGDDGRSPEPANPRPSTPWDGTSTPDDRLPSDVVAVLDDDQLQLWSITGGPGGAEAVLWRGCDFDPCQFAVVTRDGDEVSGEVLGASFPLLSTVPGGWLVEDGGFTRLSPEGDRTEIFDTGPGSGDVREGDTAVRTSQGWRLLRGDKLLPMPSPVADAVVTGAHVTPDGRLVVAAIDAGGRYDISTLGPDGTWGGSFDADTLADTGTARSPVLAGNGDHLVLAVLGDDPDGSIPVLGVQVSHDAGRTWTPVRGIDTEGGDRVRNLSSLAVDTDGTAYLATETHHLVRIDDDELATAMQLSASDSAVFTSGDEVCVVGERGRYDALLCSPDGITGWSDRALPGFR